jgi:NADPH2:quinone reductase
MNTQTAIAITAAGGPEVLALRRVDVPVPGDEEVLIEVAYAGVNRHDCNQRRRGPTPNYSDVPGLEVSGVVRAIGSRVRGISPGQSVCALVDGGGYAQYACALASHALVLDGTGIELDTAAALPEAMFTVWHNFFNVARLGPGESVLIHGGTSGVGSFAIQLLGLLGHPVFATCGSDAKCEQALALGAVAAINYRSQRFEQEIARLTHGRGVDVILDMAGTAYGPQNVEAIARRGRMVHLSPTDGAEWQASLRALMAKEAWLTGSLLRPLPAIEKSLIAQALRRVVLPLVAAKKIRPLVHQVLPLAEAAEAHRRLESGDVMGKLLLDARNVRELN